jgi:hypothetical protein
MACRRRVGIWSENGSQLLQLDSSALEAIRSATLLLGPFFTALVTLFVHDLKI